MCRLSKHQFVLKNCYQSKHINAPLQYPPCMIVIDYHYQTKKKSALTVFTEAFKRIHRLI